MPWIAPVASSSAESFFGVRAALLKHADAANARFGQSSARWRVLLHASAGGKSVSDIARATGDSRQAVQRLADDLVAEGSVRYPADEADRRKRHLELTEADAATFGRIEARWAGRLLGRIPEREIVAVTEALERIGSVLEKGR